MAVCVQITSSPWAQVSHEELRLKLEGILHLIWKTTKNDTKSLRKLLHSLDCSFFSLINLGKCLFNNLSKTLTFGSILLLLFFLYYHFHSLSTLIIIS